MHANINQKDQSIKFIVNHLQKKFGSENIIIRDHWEGDNCAIGLSDKQNKNLVYISTYSKKANAFFVELESPPENETTGYTNSGSFDNINIERLEELIKMHLEL